MRTMTRKKMIVITVIALVFISVAYAAFLSGSFVEADETTEAQVASELTSDDMQALAPYMDPDINEEVKEVLGGSGTAQEWLEKYVEIDPSFSETIEEVLGVTISTGSTEEEYN